MSQSEEKATARRTRQPRVKPASVGTDQPTRVLHQFRGIFNLLKSHLQQVERTAGIGGVQVWALSILHENPGMGVNGLAHALNVRQPTASIIVGKLSNNGLIEVRKEGADRRSVQLHINPAGRKVLRSLPGLHAGVLPSSLRALDPATLEQLEASLSKLIALIEGTDEAGSTKPI